MRTTRRQDRRAELATFRKAQVPIKGETACNRTACQTPIKEGERYWNTETRAFYCKRCAMRINESMVLCIPEAEVVADDKDDDFTRGAHDL